MKTTYRKTYIAPVSACITLEPHSPLLDGSGPGIDPGSTPVNPGGGTAPGFDDELTDFNLF